MIYYASLIIMTMIGSSASFFLKKASGFKTIKEVIKNKNLYIGGVLYGASAIINVWVLKYLDYSVVLPLTSITYVWTIFLSKKYLNEVITKRKVMGVTLIIVGAIFISMS